MMYAAHHLYLSHSFAPAAVRKVRDESVREGTDFVPKFAVRCDRCLAEYDDFAQECEMPGCVGRMLPPDPMQLVGIKALFDCPDPDDPGLTMRRILERTTEYQQELSNWFWRLRFDEHGLPAAIDVLPTEFMERYRGPPKAFCPRCYKSSESDDASQLRPKEYIGRACSACGGKYEAIAATKYNVSGFPIARYSGRELLDGKVNVYGDGVNGYPKVLLVQYSIRTLAWMEIYQSDAYGLQEYPETIVVAKGVSQTAIDQMLEAVRKKKTERRSKKTHLIIGLTSPDAEMQQPIRMMPTLVEMDAAEFKVKAREEIAANWGVSPTSMGIPVPGKLGNEAELIEVSINTCESSQSEIEEAVNARLLPLFGVTDWRWEMRSPRKDNLAEKLGVKLQAMRLFKELQSAGFSPKLSGDGMEVEPGEFIGKPEPAFPKPAFLQPDGGTDVVKASRNLPPGEAPPGLTALEDDFVQEAQRIYLKHFGPAIRDIPPGTSAADISARLDAAARAAEEELARISVRFVGDVAALSFEDEGAAFNQVDRNALELIGSNPDGFFTAIRTFPRDVAMAMRERVFEAYARPEGLDLRAMTASLREVAAGENFPVHFLVVRRYRAGITKRAEVFGWVKTKCTRVPPAAHQLAFERRQVSLGAVFDHLELVLLSERGNRRQVVRLAVEVDRQNRFGFFVNQRLNPADVKGERISLNVGKAWHRAGTHNRRHAGVVGVALGNHLVAGSDAAGLECQVERIRAVTHRHAVLRTNGRGPLLLERRHFLG